MLDTSPATQTTMHSPVPDSSQRRRTPGRIKLTGGRNPTFRSEKSYLTRKKDYTMKEDEHTKIKESQTDSEDEASFEDHNELSSRVAKSMYFANKLPSIPRPSLPLTALAVDAFTNGTFAPKDDCLEFLDLEVAAEIGRSACVSPTSLIMALVYMERLSNHNPGYLSATKPSELFVVSLLVASKFIQDDGEDMEIWNDEWANSAKMDLKRVNKLELQFLTAIDWKVNVSKEEYDKILRNVEGKLALNQGLDRGWFTYTEIETLSNSILAWSIIWPTLCDYFLMVISAASMIYTTLLATAVTSSILGPQIFILSRTLLSTTVISNYQPGISQSSRPFCGSINMAVSENENSTIHASRYQNIRSTTFMDNENGTDAYSPNFALFDGSDYETAVAMEQVSSMSNLISNQHEFITRTDRFESNDNEFEDLPLFHHKSVSLRSTTEEKESVFVQNLGHLLSSRRGKCCDNVDWFVKRNNKQYFGRLGFPMSSTY